MAATGEREVKRAYEVLRRAACRAVGVHEVDDAGADLGAETGDAGVETRAVAASVTRGGTVGVVDCGVGVDWLRWTNQRHETILVRVELGGARVAEINDDECQIAHVVLQEE